MKKKLKLALNRETLRQLTSDLARVHGGAIRRCETDDGSCHDNTIANPGVCIFYTDGCPPAPTVDCPFSDACGGGA